MQTKAILAKHVEAKDQDTTSGCNSPEQITNENIHWPQSQGISVIATLASTDSAV